jgi:hypothetical protein
MPKLDYGESKCESKGDSDSPRDRRAGDAKGTDNGHVQVNTTLERGELLMYVADEANSKLFGPDARLSQFVGKYTPDWEVAVEGEVLSYHSPSLQYTRSSYPAVRHLHTLCTPPSCAHEAFDSDVYTTA